MGIRDEANGVDAALKRGSASAKSLDQSMKQSANGARLFAMGLSLGNQNLFAMLPGVAQLTEGLISASKASAALTAGLTGGVTLILSAVAATVMWKDANQNIAQQVKDINAQTAVATATASNLPKLARERLAEELRITAEKQKQLDAIKKEQDFLLGLGKKMHDYSELIAAVNANAEAKMKAFDAEAERNARKISDAFARQAFEARQQAGLQADIELANAGFGIRSETGRFRTPVAFRGPEDQARELLRLQQLQAEQQATNQFFDPELGRLPGLDAVLFQIQREFKAKGEQLEQSFIRPLGDQLGRTFASSIADGIAAGVQSGSIEKGFRNLTGGMLIGFGRMMVEIGTQSLIAARLLDSVISALKAFAPAGAIGPALALIAGGAILQGIGSALAGGGGGGGGGFSGGGGGGSAGGATIIDRGLINPANAFAGSASITPTAGASPVIFLIGKDDPRAQRDLVDMIDRGRARRGGT